jgi:hypothetical protein
MSRLKWLHTALHELCHFLFDAPELGDTARYRRHCGDPDDPREVFADAFACVCMLPLIDLKKLAREDVAEMHPMLLEFYRQRIVVLAEMKW